MSFTYKKRKNGREYLYFKAGGKGPYYIAPKGSPESANIANVKKALEYMKTRINSDKATMDKLLAFLPKSDRENFEKS